MKPSRVVAVAVATVVSAAVIAMLSHFRYGPEGEELDLSVRLTESQLAITQQTGSIFRVIAFGFDLRASPQEDARQYLPFLKYLERATGYRFQLRFTPKGGNLARELGMGMVDLAAVGAVSFIHANQSHGVVPLVRGLNAGNKATYRSMIVVLPESPIGSLAELRGKRFAFGSMDSTQGHIIPRISLLEHGIALKDFAQFDFTGSHQNCANAVMSGQYDACGMQDTMASRLAGEGKLRILYASPDFPSSGIAANKDLPPEALANIRKALLDFDPKGRDKGGLYNWDRTEMPNGFAPVAPNDYAALRAAIRRLEPTI